MSRSIRLPVPGVRWLRCPGRRTAGHLPLTATDRIHAEAVRHHARPDDDLRPCERCEATATSSRTWVPCAAWATAVCAPRACGRYRACRYQRQRVCGWPTRAKRVRAAALPATCASTSGIRADSSSPAMATDLHPLDSGADEAGPQAWPRSVRIDTFDGRETVAIPAGCQTEGHGDA